LTEPVLAPVRSLLPAVGGFDFSALGVMLGLQDLQAVLVSLFG